MGYQPVEKPLDWFKGNPENYRSHPAPQVEVLQESIRRFGVFRNVVARPDGTILAGHGILAAAQAEGLKSFPCIIFDGSDEEARALMVADNEQARLAVNDDRALTELLKSLSDAEPALLQVTGFDEMMLANLVFVTRPESEIRDFDAAAEWVGMPDMGEAQRQTRVQLIVWCDTDEERNDALQLLGVEKVTHKKNTISVHWPEKERGTRRDATLRFREKE